MTAYFIFEFKFNADPERIQGELFEIWRHSGYGSEVEIWRWESHGTLICNLFYYRWNDPGCRERIEKILGYLFNISIDGRVYYYRFQEAMQMYGKSKQKITLDQLFSEYYPTLGSYGIRYEVKRF